jgi:Cd2+/Zn2+-exporting ATPase
LERLASGKIAVFDKTGTLTEGRFRVTKVCPVAESEETLLTTAALAEGYSHHPLASALRDACGDDLDLRRVSEVKEIAGRGVVATVDGKTVSVGNATVMEALSLDAALPETGGTAVHVARDGQYLGYILLSDAVKDGAAEALTALRRLGVSHQVMLTGDNGATAASVAKVLPLDGYRAALLPDGKVAEVETLLSERRKGEALIFVGDGINDAPVLARADVGVAMGALGSDAAIEAADVVIMNDDLRRLGDAVTIARKTKAIVWQNVIFSLAVKAGVLFLSLFGAVPMWLAVFADVGVMVLAVGNAMRAIQV